MTAVYVICPCLSDREACHSGCQIELFYVFIGIQVAVSQRLSQGYLLDSAYKVPVAEKLIA